MRFKRLFIFVLVIVILGIISISLEEGISFRAVFSDDSDVKYEFEEVFVERVIDGDTIRADIGDIRLLGINTPERGKKYYDEAKDFLKEVENKSVLVLRDIEDIDKYDRKLRYVYYEDRIMNIEILERGLGTSFMLEDLNLEEKFVRAEQFAMDSEVGLWKKSEDRCADCIELVELDAEEEFFILKNICDFYCRLDGWIVKDNANHFFKLDSLDGGESERYESKTRIWNNDGDRFFMRDDKGFLVVFYRY